MSDMCLSKENKQYHYRHRKITWHDPGANLTMPSLVQSIQCPSDDIIQITNQSLSEANKKLGPSGIYRTPPSSAKYCVPLQPNGRTEMS